MTPGREAERAITSGRRILNLIRRAEDSISGA